MPVPSVILLDRAINKEAKSFCRQNIKLSLHDFITSTNHLHKLKEKDWGFVLAIEIKDHNPDREKLREGSYKRGLWQYLNTTFAKPNRKFSKMKQQVIREPKGAPGKPVSGITSRVTWTVQVLHSK